MVSVRPGLIVALALVAASCSAGVGGEGSDVDLSAGTTDSTSVEVRFGPASQSSESTGQDGQGTLVIDPPDGAPGGAPPTSIGGGSESAAGGSAAGVAPSGPATSVVAQAVVPEVVARAEPSPSAPVVASLDHPTAIGSPLVFLVDDAGDAAPGWLEVQLPIPPNGTTGWVRRDEVTLFANPYRIEVDRASHRLRVFEEGRLWVETPIAVGTGATPTPVGEFYLLELLAPPDPTGPYGPYAFGLSGFSEVLDSFGGADEAIIGLHGTDDPSALGTDVSFGCIRMANEVIERLAAVVPLGTPVVIT